MFRLFAAIAPLGPHHSDREEWVEALYKILADAQVAGVYPLSDGGFVINYSYRQATLTDAYVKFIADWAALHKPDAELGLHPDRRARASWGAGGSEGWLVPRPCNYLNAEITLEYTPGY
jgi:hypothetical protein